MMHPDTVRALQGLPLVRHQRHDCFLRREDALFELVDAVLASGPISSLPHLSLALGHQRGWGSVYGALTHGRVDVEPLRVLLAKHPLADGQPIYAVDVSVWPRCDAETSPERGYYYHPARHSAGQPIVAGWAYQWLVQLSFARDSWTAPLDVRRVHPTEDADAVAVAQITALVRRRPSRGRLPLFVFDAGYNSVAVSLGLAEVPVAILVRLRADRCFYADPDPAEARSTGRPRRHGAKFDCKAPSTWPPPTAEHTTEDEQYGTVRVQTWAGLHPKQQAHPTRGTRRARPIVRGTLVRVEVSRLPGRAYQPQILWLWWHGPGTPDLDVLWRAYVRRFDLEIVRTQVTKPGVGAVVGRWDHVPDLHRAVRHHHAIDEQLDQLALLLEGCSFEAAAQPVTDGGRRSGDLAEFGQALPLGGDLAVLRVEVIPLAA